MLIYIILGLLGLISYIYNSLHIRSDSSENKAFNVTWNTIHSRAYKAQSRKEQISFIEFMKDICSKLGCGICKYHCIEYIKNHPIEEYLDILHDIKDEKMPLGMFIWTWKFHNAVNERIKKPIISWDTAYNLYSQIESKDSVFIRNS